MHLSLWGPCSFFVALFFFSFLPVVCVTHGRSRNKRRTLNQLNISAHVYEAFCSVYTLQQCTQRLVVARSHARMRFTWYKADIMFATAQQYGHIALLIGSTKIKLDLPPQNIQVYVGVPVRVTQAGSVPTGGETPKSLAFTDLCELTPRDFWHALQGYRPPPTAAWHSTQSAVTGRRRTCTVFVLLGGSGGILPRGTREIWAREILAAISYHQLSRRVRMEMS